MALTVQVRGQGPYADAQRAAAAAAGWRVLEESRPRPEAVAHALQVVILPDPLMAEVSEITDLLARGISVAAQPPWHRTIDEVSRLVEAQSSSRQPFLHMEPLAYAPVFQALRSRLNTLGTPHHIEVRSLWPAAVIPSGYDRTDLALTPIALMLLIAHETAAGALTEVAVTAPSAGSTDHTAPLNTAPLNTAPLDTAPLNTAPLGISLRFAGGLRATVVAGSTPGHHRLCEIQVASATGVLRAEILPTPQLEHNGVVVGLPPVATNPPELEMFGHLGQLRALETALGQATAPITDARLGAAVIDVIERISPADDPSR